MILIAGPPGAGKSIQAHKLSELGKVQWLSTGDLLRATVDEEVKEVMLRGDLLPDEMVQRVLSEAIEQVPFDTRILIDGFPRNEAQAVWFVQYVKLIDRDLSHALHIRISLDEAIHRLVKRGREDDKEEVVRTRYHQYERDIVPMLAHMGSMGVQVHEIDGEKSIDDVYKQIVIACGSVF